MGEGVVSPCLTPPPAPYVFALVHSFVPFVCVFLEKASLAVSTKEEFYTV